VVEIDLKRKRDHRPNQKTVEGDCELVTEKKDDEEVRKHREPIEVRLGRRQSFEP